MLIRSDDTTISHEGNQVNSYYGGAFPRQGAEQKVNANHHESLLAGDESLGSPAILMGPRFSNQFTQRATILMGPPV